jgi:hypothetical protein
MSDPRDVAHAKKVTQEKKHHGTDASPAGMRAVQPGKKPAAAMKKSGPAGAAVEPQTPAPGKGVGSIESLTPSPGLEASLVVLAKLKELEFHSRAHLERLAELALTVEEELKQTDVVGPLGEVYAAQSAVQTKLTSLIEAYKAECDRLQGD